MAARRTRSITIRLSEKEFQSLVEEAGTLSLSEHIRRRLVQKDRATNAFKYVSALTKSLLEARLALAEADRHASKLETDLMF